MTFHTIAEMANAIEVVKFANKSIINILQKYTTSVKMKINHSNVIDIDIRYENS